MYIIDNEIYNLSSEIIIFQEPHTVDFHKNDYKIRKF